MAKCEKIMICGFSGSGKTSLMREIEFLAPDSSWVFEDLDQRMAKSQKRPGTAEIIQELGWEKFRLLERQTLESWLKDEGPGVISLGGGALNQNLLDLYKKIKMIRLCYLKASFEVCWERLHLENTEPRPLVSLGKNELHRIYEERKKVFEQIPWTIENQKGSNLTQLAQAFWETLASS